MTPILLPAGMGAVPSSMVHVRTGMEHRVMAMEYTAWIAEEDYEAFRKMLVPIMPDSYELWLRVRERGKRRAFEERAAMLEEVEVYPEEFKAFCARRARADFSIYGLDLFAREKAYSARRSKPMHSDLGI